ncbi:MAG: ASPIC/UnbV domain-containing protein [Planctomycetota bacterium]
MLIGLGDSTEPVNITVTWPDLSQTKLPRMEVRQYHEVRKQGG